MKPYLALTALLFISFTARAEGDTKSSSCPDEELCPKLTHSMEACKKDRKSKSCDEFVSAFEKLVPRFQCKRPFDTEPVPAIWLCSDSQVPSPLENAAELLSKLKSQKARAFFGSPEFRSTLDGDVAEEYLEKSRRAGRKKSR